MATTGAIGGSVLDVQALVSQLVTAERAPYDARVARETDKTTTQISALASLKAAMTGFQTVLKDFGGVTEFGSRKALSADIEVFTAAAGPSAAAGAYDVEVQQLASAQQLASSPFATGPTSVVGTGTLTIALGGLSFDVAIGESGKTLAGIRDAINSAIGNTGVQATLVNATGGSRLVLTSGKTGEINEIQVTQSGGDGGLAQLTYGPGNVGHYTEVTQALDAEVEVAGFPVSSTTNTLDDVIQGVTLNLVAADAGTKHRLTVQLDTAAVTDKVKGFVAAYNSLQGTIGKLRGYDSATKTGGPMLGDALVSGIEMQLRRGLTDAVGSASATYSTLVAIGVTTLADGSLKINDAKLQSALTKDFEAVGRLFAGTGGVATRMHADLQKALAADGAVTARSTGLVQRQRDLTREQDAIDARMQVVEERYIRQFSTLDTLLSRLQTTSAYLSQQLDALPKPNSTLKG